MTEHYLTAVNEMRTQGVNTPYQPSRDGWSYSLSSQTSSLLGGEEEEMEAILRELLAAFPKQTKRCKYYAQLTRLANTYFYPVAVATDKNTKIFKAVEEVGNNLTSLVGHIKR